MIPITYVTGDATYPQGGGKKVIAHVCNDQGAWGAGFVLALSKRSKIPEIYYRKWAKDNIPLPLGYIQFAPYVDDIIVVNMIAQHGFEPPAIRYIALAQCLTWLRLSALQHGRSVHMPRIGCGLAGGSWDKVEPLITMLVCKHDVPVTVYDL